MGSRTGISKLLSSHNCFIRFTFHRNLRPEQQGRCEGFGHEFVHLTAAGPIQDLAFALAKIKPPKIKLDRQNKKIPLANFSWRGSLMLRTEMSRTR